MNEKQYWTGVAPSPAVLARLDFEEMAVLALLTWCTAANQPVTSADVARLADRDSKPLGMDEAREIVQHLGEMKLVSVFGMGNERPMSIRVGGFQPRTPKRFAADHRATTATGPRAIPPQRRSDVRRPMPGRKQGGTPPWILKDRRVETGLAATPHTPAYVLPEAARLREKQIKIEDGSLAGTLVEQAQARLDVLLGRIALYERWLRDEPRHRELPGILTKKRAAVAEMQFQVERAHVKQAELEASTSD